ncbi:hypothetical protein Trydic_g11855 [Trypoxylus dichotomus]
MALGSTRTSITTELGWLIKHHIFVDFNDRKYQELSSHRLAGHGLAITTDHLMKSQCSIRLTGNRLLYTKPLAHFMTTSILNYSLDYIKSKQPSDSFKRDRARRSPIDVAQTPSLPRTEKSDFGPGPVRLYSYVANAFGSE